MHARYRPRVYALCNRILKTIEDSEDATQQTFLKIHKSLKNWRGDSALSSWIYRIAHNEALMMIRRLRAYKPHELYYEDLEFNLLEAIGCNSPQSDPYLRRQITKAVSLLPAQYKNSILTTEIEELGNAEAAAILNLTVPAVKSRRHRGRNILKTKLAKPYEELLKAA